MEQLIANMEFSYCLNGTARLLGLSIWNRKQKEPCVRKNTQEIRLTTLRLEEGWKTVTTLVTFPLKSSGGYTGKSAYCMRQTHDRSILNYRMTACVSFTSHTPIFSKSHILCSHHLAQMCRSRLIVDIYMTFTYLLLFLPEILKKNLYQKHAEIKITVPYID